ncbi:MAG TPA: LLM class flavin-dependent oxidoreductase [Candidatus Dormibacteraeota bacterium]|nr:LLM class flavin-dependent oxidoreductase [Candidatus Dormibacteraeota bacterium]
MRVGIGLPTSTPGVGGALLLDWARQADAGPFSSLGVIDRLDHDCWDPLAALAAAAAVTDRVRLVTMVVIGPLQRTALLARQAATVDALSEGRLVLGLGLGARYSDYEAAGVDHRRRGAALTRQLVELREAWDAGRGSPAPAQRGGPSLLVGGAGSAAFARAAGHADGYVHGGGPPRAFAAAAARARAAWADAGRPGSPQLWGQAYFALGDAEVLAAGAAYLRDYYRFTGGFEERIVAGCLRTPSAVKDLVRGYEEEGCDELVLLPTVSRLDQVERLADVLGP